ncbi:MAG: hypothetical protein AAF416_06305 [Pseudomonadota bacterium]
MRFVLSVFCGLIAVFSLPAAANDLTQTVIERAGQPVEVRGTQSRVVGFFSEADDRLDVTLLISGHAPGPVLRTGARLVEGQRFSMQRRIGTGGNHETVMIRRQGDIILLSISSGRQQAPVAAAFRARLATAKE